MCVLVCVRKHPKSVCTCVPVRAGALGTPDTLDTHSAHPWTQLRFGMLILVVHDVSDVFLDIMKMANYLKIEGYHGFYVTEIAFVFNTYVSWPFLRFYKFVTLIYTVMIPYKALCPHAAQDGGSYFLCVLLCLHIHWWTILQRIALKIIRGGDPSQAGDEEYEVVDKKKQ